MRGSCSCGTWIADRLSAPSEYGQHGQHGSGSVCPMRHADRRLATRNERARFLRGCLRSRAVAGPSIAARTRGGLDAKHARFRALVATRLAQLRSSLNDDIGCSRERKGTVARHASSLASGSPSACSKAGTSARLTPRCPRDRARSRSTPRARQGTPRGSSRRRATSTLGLRQLLSHAPPFGNAAYMTPLSSPLHIIAG